MDLKQKLKQLLVSKQVPLRSPVSPSEGSGPGTFPGADDNVETRIHEPDPPTDDEILASIEEVYFTDSTFDASDYELKKLPELLDVHQVWADQLHLKQQMQVVSKRLSDLILQNQPAYVKELERVMELQSDLEEALQTCVEGRSELSKAQRQCTEASLGILANYCKRQQLLNVLRSLRTIKTLQQTDVRLSEMLEEENFPGAIQLCLECQKAASTFRHYKCISELTSKLQDTLEMIEELLDVALSKVCNHFNTKHYEKLQTAYVLLGKTQTAMDQLHMHFSGAIHKTAFGIVLGYVELCSTESGTNFQKQQYSELCNYVTSECFNPCLVNLCKSLWEVMRSYHRIMEWHRKRDNENQEMEAGDAEKGLEPQFNKQYVHQKLENGLGRIWQDIQQKVKIYLSATDLSAFKFNDFIRVLDLVNRLIAVGEEFCGSKSEELQESMRKQSINYFRSYHRTRMDELRIFLENEGWELCPVKSNFAIMQLLEFRFLRNARFFHTKNISLAMISPAHGRGDGLKPDLNFFQLSQTENGFNPFELQLDDEDEDVLQTSNMTDGELFEDTDSDDSDIPDELKQDFVDEQTGETPVKKHSKFTKNVGSKGGKGHGPLLTNTTLNVLRLFGKYMQMMTVLKPIAYDVTVCMTQLFDYYMFAVYIFFAVTNDRHEMEVSNKLRCTLKRISDNLVMDENGLMQTMPPANNHYREKVLKPKFSMIVDMSSPEKLFGLPERVVAAESLVFLAEQFEYLQQYIDLLIPATKKTFLQQYYIQTVNAATELRRPIYISVATNSIDCEQILNHMNSVKWDIKDIMSQHSTYVDNLLRMMQVFSMRLAEVGKIVPIPTEAYNILWEHCIRLTNWTFVEGFSNAKKCNNEGRALMQLDYQQFLMKLEKITDLRPIPDKEFVETYIKAYYFTEENLEKLIKNYKEYSGKHIVALLDCMSHINKKTRQRMMTVMEETRR